MEDEMFMMEFQRAFKFSGDLMIFLGASSSNYSPDLLRLFRTYYFLSYLLFYVL